MESSEPPQIHNLLRSLRIAIGAVEAVKSQDKFGPKFPVRGAKDLVQKLANALNALNIAAPVVHQEITLIDTDKIPANERQSGQPVFRTLAHVKSTVRLIAPDTSFIDLVGSGHGGDVDDKSGGKASTYAWKDALLKGLSIPHEDMVDTDDDSSTGGGEPVARRAASNPGKESSGSKQAARSAGRGEGAVQAGDGRESVSTASAAVGEMEEGAATDATGIAYVLGKIAAAESEMDLEQIRTAVKSGVLALHGADRLTATKAFMEKKKELAGAGKSTSATN